MTSGVRFSRNLINALLQQPFLPFWRRWWRVHRKEQSAVSVPSERVSTYIPGLPLDRILCIILANPPHYGVKPFGEWLVRNIEARIDAALSERRHSVPIGLVRCHPLDNRKGIINSIVRILVSGNVLALQRWQYRLIPKAQDWAAVCRITFSDFFAVGTPVRANDRCLFFQMSQKLYGIFGSMWKPVCRPMSFSRVQRGIMRPQTAHFIMAHSAVGPKRQWTSCTFTWGLRPQPPGIYRFAPECC